MASKININFDFSKDRKKVEALEDAVIKSGTSLEQLFPGEGELEEFEGLNSKKKLKKLRTAIPDAIESAGEKLTRTREESTNKLDTFLQTTSKFLTPEGSDNIASISQSVLDSGSSDPFRDVQDVLSKQRSIQEFQAKDTRTPLEKQFATDINQAADAGVDAELIAQVKSDLVEGVIDQDTASSKLGKAKKRVSKFTPEFKNRLKDVQRVLSVVGDDEKKRLAIMEQLEFEFPDFASDIRGILKRPGKLEDSFKAIIEAFSKTK